MKVENYSCPLHHMSANFPIQTRNRYVKTSDNILKKCYSLHKIRALDSDILSRRLLLSWLMRLLKICDKSEA
jgi:hypothetical protein